MNHGSEKTWAGSIDPEFWYFYKKIKYIFIIKSVKMVFQSGAIKIYFRNREKRVLWRPNSLLYGHENIWISDGKNSG